MRRRRGLPLLVSLWLLLATGAAADEPLSNAAEHGLPLIRSYSAQSLRSVDNPFAAATYAALQSADGALLFANEAGIIRFDGRHWRNLGGDFGIPFALTIGPDGQLYAGGASRLWQLEWQADASLIGHDLAALAGTELELRGDYWVAAASSREVFFGSANHLLRLADGRLTVVEANGPYSFGTVAHDRLFVNAAGRGVIWVDGEQSGLLAGSEFLADHRVYGTLALPDGKAVLLVDGQGLLQFDARQVDEPSLAPFAPELSERLLSARVYSGLRLRDGSLAIGTRTGGLFLIDQNGRLLQHLDASVGLASNLIFHILEDQAGQLWLSHDQGLSVIEYPGQLSNFGPQLAALGQTEGLARIGQRLILSTRAGAFELQAAADSPAATRFEPLFDQHITVSEVRQIGEQTLAATEWGLARLDDAEPRLFRSQVLRQLLAPEGFPGWLLSITAGGVSLWQQQEDDWVELGPISEITPPVDSLVEHQGRIWISAASASRLISFRLRASEDDGRPIVDDLQGFGPDQGVPTTAVFIQPFEDRLLLATERGLLERADDRFVPAADFQRVQEQIGRHAWRIRPVNERELVLYEGQRIAHLVRDGEHFRQIASPLDRLPRGSVIMAILAEKDGTVWIATDANLYRHDPQRQSALPPRPLLGVEMLTDASVLLARANGGQPPTGLKLDPIQSRNVQFNFASSPDTLLEGLRFRSKLQGHDPDWTEWSAQEQRHFTNLGTGRYRFQVQAMDLFGQLSDEAVLELQVPPPTHLHPLAWLAYVFVTGAFILLLGRWQTHRLAERNRLLQAEVNARTAELRQAAVKDPMTGLPNRRFLRGLLQASVDDPLFAEHRALSDRADPRPLVIGLADIDHFKRINDQLGHAVGDEMIQAVGQTMHQLLTEDPARGALVCRWGGEEFLFLFRCQPDEHPEQTVRAMLEKIAELRAETAATRLPLSASIGWLALPQLSLDQFDAVLSLADELLLRAKREGRARALGSVAPMASGGAASDWREEALTRTLLSTRSNDLSERPNLL